jgi:hypothetical protein
LTRTTNRDNVSQAKTDAADEAIAQVEPPQLVRGEAGQKDAEAVKKSARERDHARTALVEPEAAQEGKDSQGEDADGEGQSHIGDGPVKLFGEGSSENAPRIDGAEGHLHQEACRRDAPSIWILHFLSPANE